MSRRGPAAAVTFDPDDLDAAYAELDDRYAAGDAEVPLAASRKRDDGRELTEVMFTAALRSDQLP